MGTPLSQFEKIQIILHEYDTLRNELHQRYAAIFQSISVLAVVFIGLVTVLTERGFRWSLLALLSGSVVLFLIIILVINYDTWKAATRLREIESDINSRSGERLLRWETGFGIRRLADQSFVQPNAGFEASKTLTSN